MARFVVGLCLFLSIGCGHRSSPTAPTSQPPPTTMSSACGGDPECQTLTSIQPARAYLLHVPASFRPDASGLVIALHGSGESGTTFRSRTQLSEKADQAGFAVAYPYALLSPGAGISVWNELFNNSFGGNPPDDVGFLKGVDQGASGTASSGSQTYLRDRILKRRFHDASRRHPAFRFCCCHCRGTRLRRIGRIDPERARAARTGLCSDVARRR